MYGKSSLVVLIIIGLLSLQSGNTAFRASALDTTPAPTPSATEVLSTKANPTIFLIMMENHNWADIKGSASAPYINQTLLPMGAHAERYFNPPNLHPSEPNYIWLEAGTNFGIAHDALPMKDHINSTQHLVTLLNNAGVTWKSYLEDIDGKRCPVTSQHLYAPTHNPMAYFDDVTTRDNSRSYCIDHMRPYDELAADLQHNALARYNFIVPNLCNDMHNSKGCASDDSIKNGDNWLSREMPQLLNSSAYQDGGVILVLWDEGEGKDGPIGLIVLSPNAKPGYSNTIHYTHSSTLRTLQEIFGVKPWLGDAANAKDLSDLFATFP